VWNLGFIASFVSFGIAAGAVALYRMVARQPVTQGAFWALLVVIVVAVVVAFLAGLAMEPGQGGGHGTRHGVLLGGLLGFVLAEHRRQPGALPTYTRDNLFTVLFTVLGCFGTVRALSLKGFFE
jgi:hypothetical protein